MGGQDVKWGEVQKKKRKFSEMEIQAKILEKEVLEQEHKEKRVNGVFFWVRFASLGKFVISLLRTLIHDL